MERSGFLSETFSPLSWDPVHYMKIEAVGLTLNGSNFFIFLNASVLAFSLFIAYLHCSNLTD